MRKAIYQGKKVRATQIGTQGLEGQLKLEKVSEEEYSSKNNDTSPQKLNE